MCIESMLKEWWVTPHSDDLRLSRSGVQFLTNALQLKSYAAHFQEKEISGRLILLMCRHLKEPFFYHRGSILMFGEKEAMMIKLCGTVEQYLAHLETIGKSNG